METKLIIARHGTTDWSIQKRYCGHADIGLNGAGKNQALKLRKALKNKGISAVYASGARRAREFAAIAFEGRPLTIMTGLKEINFGIFEGLTHDDLTRKHPEIYLKWIDNPRRINIPGGEGMEAFRKRIKASLGEIILKNKNKTTVIVTHGGVIKAIISDILKIEDIWNQRLDWGCVCAVISKKDGRNKWEKSALL